MTISQVKSTSSKIMFTFNTSFLCDVFFSRTEYEQFQLYEAGLEDLTNQICAEILNLQIINRITMKRFKIDTYVMYIMYKLMLCILEDTNL